MDSVRLRASWHSLTAHGGQVPLFFYSTLFLANPDIRQMFPAAMAGQRDKLMAALGNVVANVDTLDAAVPFLQQLGRDHRKFAVTAEHYPAVGHALLATLAHFLGEEWTNELADDWAAAYKLVADVMMAAAQQRAHAEPAWWEAEVIAHERRTLDVAVLTVRTEPAIPYLAGQSVAVETALRPRVWRYYTPANAPSPDGTIELHVRLVDGGPVSSALVQAVGVGDVLRLGAPVGTNLTVSHSRDVVFVAGGTGLAPFKALLGQFAGEPFRRRVHLFAGARSGREFYDLAALSEWQRALPQLTVVRAVSEDPRFPGEHGDVADVAARYSSWPDQEIYVCGSPEMVAAGRNRLRAAGVGAERIHCEDFTTYAGPTELSTKDQL
ncbi:hypothetical protein HFP15_17310 [Amycolatopsis sp. K13G38]|uniref:nitric oxide dioxygenase n=1 Tax=Amycolatopsis acididurans TaxID=2724524 RepID=A0ABX1J4F8_9PSEU|nr:globin domain-containing protein [Amycolatopsis acididurans]NKQ54643.1 hypothetical protein [Amycolatopsis acididurans]